MCCLVSVRVRAYLNPYPEITENLFHISVKLRQPALRTRALNDILRENQNDISSIYLEFRFRHPFNNGY